MVFSTHLFLFYFLPAVLIVYYSLPLLRHAAGFSQDQLSWLRNLWLLAVSYVFYGWWNPWFVLLMFSVSAGNYLFGWLMSRPGAKPNVRFWSVTSAIVLSLSALGFFKYFTFLQVNLNQLFKAAGADGMTIFQIALPVGISFYVFQSLSYSVDVYRGTAPPARTFVDFACYVALFPQLIAGPIVRYNTIAEQLVRRRHDWDRYASGAALFTVGLAKKVLLANPIGRIADAAFDAQAISTTDAWFGVVAFACQLYFDFSGYSDMAVGLGRMLGFEFPKNFDAPYRAESITDFWRRWHISLSAFLRDYLYIPLGGNRRGPLRTYANLGIVMLLGGLWHGANWTYLVWGGYHGALLAWERWRNKRSLYTQLPRPVRILITFLLVLVSWVLFRAESLSSAVSYLAVMCGRGSDEPTAMLLAAELHGRSQWILMLLALVLIFSPQQAFQWTSRLTALKALILFAILVLTVSVMSSQSFNPFLYFQF